MRFDLITSPSSALESGGKNLNLVLFQEISDYMKIISKMIYLYLMPMNYFTITPTK